MKNIVTLGYSHTYNALKFRILDTLFKSDEPMIVRDIEYETGIHYANISSTMSHYQKLHKKSGKIIKLPYIKRLAKKGPHGLNSFWHDKGCRHENVFLKSRIGCPMY